MSRVTVTEFIFAAKRGKLPIVKKYTEEGGNINANNESGSLTALIIACIEDHPKIVEFLVSQPSLLVNHTNFYRETALHSACVLNRTEIVELLFRKSDIDVDLQTLKGRTALMELYIYPVDIIKMVLTKTKNIDLADKNGNTALMHFCKYGTQGAEAVKLLLVKGANRDLKNNKGQTALDIANSKGFEDIASLLVSP